jgi:hypothetical protein
LNQPWLQLHHRQLDDVCAGALDRGVRGGAQLLGFHAAAPGYIQIDLQRVFAQQTTQAGRIEGEGAPAAQDRFHIAARQRQPLLQLQEGKHFGVALFVFAQELRALKHPAVNEQHADPDQRMALVR